MLATKDYLDAIHKCDERIRTNWIAFATLSYGLALAILNRDHRCWIANWSWTSIESKPRGEFDPFVGLKNAGLMGDVVTKNLERPLGSLKNEIFKILPPDTLWLYDPKEIVLCAYIVFAGFLGSLLGRAYSDRHEWLSQASRSDIGKDVPIRLLRAWSAECGKRSLHYAAGRFVAFLVIYVTAVYGICSLCKGRTGLWFEDSIGLSKDSMTVVACGILVAGAAIWTNHLLRTQRQAARFRTDANDVAEKS